MSINKIVLSVILGVTSVGAGPRAEAFKIKLAKAVEGTGAAPTPAMSQFPMISSDQVSQCVMSTCGNPAANMSDASVSRSIIDIPSNEALQAWHNLFEADALQLLKDKKDMAVLTARLS